MDRKTLEYMDERVQKAKEIIATIASLAKKAEMIATTSNISFIDHNLNTKATLESRSYSNVRGQENLIKAIKSFAIEEINREIAALEEELAKL